MIGLIQNELIKIFEKKMSWIFAIILILGLIGSAVLEMKVSDQQKEDDWKVQVQSEINKLEKKMEKAPSYNDLKEDEYPSEGTKEDIQAQIDDFNGNLTDNVNPYTTSWSYLGDFGIAMKSLITLFVVIVCAGNISSEFSDGTIKQLLIRPHRRWAILLSKYIAILIYSIFLLAVLAIAGYLVSIAFFGTAGFNDNIYAYNSAFSPETVSGGVYFLQNLAYYLPGLILILALAFMLSTLFKNQAIAVGIGIFVLFFSSTVGSIIVGLSEKYAWTKALIFPHLDQTVFIMDDKILTNITMPISLGILGVYYIIFMFITFFFFQKRDISI